MTDFCDNVESEIVNWLFGGTSPRAAAADVYVALHGTTDPGESPDGTTELDASTLSYERVQTAAGTDWNITTSQADNAVKVEFPQATEDWGDIAYFSLWDGPADTDNPLFTDVIRDSNGNAVTKTVTTDDIVSFDAGTLVATID